MDENATENYTNLVRELVRTQGENLQKQIESLQREVITGITRAASDITSSETRMRDHVRESIQMIKEQLSNHAKEELLRYDNLTTSFNEQKKELKEVVKRVMYISGGLVLAGFIASTWGKNWLDTRSHEAQVQEIAAEILKQLKK